MAPMTRASPSSCLRVIRPKQLAKVCHRERRPAESVIAEAGFGLEMVGLSAKFHVHVMPFRRNSARSARPD
jgi:hypothetical protein